VELPYVGMFPRCVVVRLAGLGIKTCGLRYGSNTFVEADSHCDCLAGWCLGTSLHDNSMGLILAARGSHFAFLGLQGIPSGCAFCSVRRARLLHEFYMMTPAIIESSTEDSRLHRCV